MDENLVGYLLKALDADTERAVENYLRMFPEAQTKLELVRQALEPLEADKEEMEPPEDLRIRTLGLVAQSRCGHLQRVPAAPPFLPAAPISWWRRADVLVAASLLLICLPLLFPLLVKAHRASKRIDCENNLRGMFISLMQYSDNHEGDLPRVEEIPPRNFAGVFVPILYQEGLLNGVSLRCPANSNSSPQPVSLEELGKLYENDRQRFEQITRELGGCYAYTLGYRSDGRLCGVRRVPGETDLLPIVADRPPFDRPDDPAILDANSQNHAGMGQNVLYLAGNVRWAVNRYVGPDDKDIFLNKNHELKAGLNQFDTVLAASGVRAEQEAPPVH